MEKTVDGMENWRLQGKNVRQEVCLKIKEYILSNNIKPGSKLPSEMELASALKVSRTSLREGIRMLEGSGYIVTRQGDGMYVAQYDGSMLLDYIQYSIHFGKDDIRDLYGVRKSLELSFIGEAAEKVTEDQLRRLREITAQMETSELLQAHWLDRDFNMVLFENISNRLVAHIITLYWDVILCRWIPNEGDAIPEMLVDNHRTIIRALESRNSDFVRASMEVHMYDSHII